MLLSDAIGHYKADRLAKGFAPSTVRNEQTTLRDFLVTAGNIQVSQLGPRQIDAFFYRKQDAWGPNTANKARAHLATFFKWCQVRGHMPRSSDPLEGTRNRRVAQKTRVVIPPDEFELVLDAAPNPRDRAIVAIGFYLFLRVSETTLLRWQDVDFDESRRGTENWTPTISIFRPKTGTTDVLPMVEELYHELRHWKLAYAAEVGETVKPGWLVVPARTQGLFTGEKGKSGSLVLIQESRLVPTKPMTDATRIVGTVLKLAGRWGVWEGGHTLRRSGAIALYNQLASVGHDRAIRMCQAMLGHAHITTTEVYLRLDLDRKTRNDLLAGKRMFPQLARNRTRGSVVSLTTNEKEAADGQADTGTV